MPDRNTMFAWNQNFRVNVFPKIEQRYHKSVIKNSVEITYYECTHCQYKTIDRKSDNTELLIRHLQNNHSKILDIGEPPRPFKCPHDECTDRKPFGRKDILNKHIERMHKEKRCTYHNECQFIYVSKRDLTLHISEEHKNSRTDQTTDALANGSDWVSKINGLPIQLENETQENDENNEIETVSPTNDMNDCGPNPPKRYVGNLTTQFRYFLHVLNFS